MKKEEIKLTKEQKDILMNLLLQEINFCNNQNANIFELLEQYKKDLHAIYQTINESYELNNMKIELKKDKVSCNFLPDVDCYEVEIIRNEPPCNTSYRIELIDNEYINITKNELRVLKNLLNSVEFEQFIQDS